MIAEVRTSKGTEAITSDQWHVVHSRFIATRGKGYFSRGITSEHLDRAECQKSAKALRARLAGENRSVPAEERDEVFLRRPNFKSLKRAGRRRSNPQ